MIRTVIVAGPRFGIGLDLEAERLRRLLHHRIERGALRARDVDRLRFANRRHGIEIQIERNARGRNRQMLAEVIGSEQPFFLRGHRRKQHGVRRLRGRRRERMREFQQNPAPGSIVHSAVINVVTGHRRIDSQVIVMSRIHNRLGRRSAVGARQHAEHVVRHERPHLAVDVRLQPHGQLTRLEAARAGQRHHVVQLETRRREQLPRHLQLDPGRRLELRIAIVA